MFQSYLICWNLTVPTLISLQRCKKSVINASYPLHMRGQPSNNPAHTPDDYLLQTVTDCSPSFFGHVPSCRRRAMITLLICASSWQVLGKTSLLSQLWRRTCRRLGSHVMLRRNTSTLLDGRSLRWNFLYIVLWSFRWKGRTKENWDLRKFNTNSLQVLWRYG